MAECIGTVKGPGETPHEFTLIAPDPERRVKHGEFVYYITHVDGEERQIIGRITARASVKTHRTVYCRMRFPFGQRGHG